MITDRYVDSALAYQGAGRGLDPAEVEQVARWATGDLRPHLTVVLDLEPARGLGRFEGRDRIEGESLEFHQRVRQAFLDLAAADPDHYLVLDARRRRRRDRRRRSASGSTPLLGQAAADASTPMTRLGRPGRPAPRRSRRCGPRPAATA